MNTILTWLSAPPSWFPQACLTSFHICPCLMFILTGFSRLMSLSNPWRIYLMLPLISGWVTWRAGSTTQTYLPSSAQSDFVPFHYLIHCSPKHCSTHLHVPYVSFWVVLVYNWLQDYRLIVILIAYCGSWSIAFKNKDSCKQSIFVCSSLIFISKIAPKHLVNCILEWHPSES